MIYHIKELNEVIESKDLEGMKKRVSTVEVISSSFLTFMIIILLVSKLIDWSDPSDDYQIDIVGIIIDFIVFAVFVLAYTAVYFILVRYLEANLNLYYGQQKCRLFWIVLANLLFMTFKTLYTIMELYEIPQNFVNPDKTLGDEMIILYTI